MLQKGKGSGSPPYAVATTADGGLGKASVSLSHEVAQAHSVALLS
jgi:hypothetical protein